MKGKEKQVYIKNAPPKLYWLVRVFFPNHCFNCRVAFSFANTIYTKYNLDEEVNKDIYAHELVHLRQMRYNIVYSIIHLIGS